MLTPWSADSGSVPVYFVLLYRFRPLNTSDVACDMCVSRAGRSIDAETLRSLKKSLDSTQYVASRDATATAHRPRSRAVTSLSADVLPAAAARSFAWTSKHGCHANRPAFSSCY